MHLQHPASEAQTRYRKWHSPDCECLESARTPALALPPLMDTSVQSDLDSVGSDTLNDAVAKLNSDIQRISTRMCATLASAEGNMAGLHTGLMPVTNSERHKIPEMSAEVVDSNPYSRLMALQQLGIVENYATIRENTIAIVGIGGVGSVAAESLARCGIGRLLLYDYDTVEMANMNRLFYRPEQAGASKTAAAACTLASINPDTEIETFNVNITSVQGFKTFQSSLLDQSTGQSRVSLVLACVDNYEARVHINRACLQLRQPWMESGVSEDAVSGHVQLVAPGETACYECVPPLLVASGVEESSLKRENVCAASLPTTMGIIAGLLVQNALKHILRFGQVSEYLQYTAMSDFFPKQTIKPNPECKQAICVELQQLHRYGNCPMACLLFVYCGIDLFRYPREYLQSEEYKKSLDQCRAAQSKPELIPSHEENEWKIELVGEQVEFEDPTETVAVPEVAVSDMIAQLEAAQI